MFNKIKEFMSNQVEETSPKKAKKDKQSEKEIALQHELETLQIELEESKDLSLIHI